MGQPESMSSLTLLSGEGITKPTGDPANAGSREKEPVKTNLLMIVANTSTSTANRPIKAQAVLTWTANNVYTVYYTINAHDNWGEWAKERRGWQRHRTQQWPSYNSTGRGQREGRERQATTRTASDKKHTASERTTLRPTTARRTDWTVDAARPRQQRRRVQSSQPRREGACEKSRYDASHTQWRTQSLSWPTASLRERFGHFATWYIGSSTPDVTLIALS